MSIDQMLRRFSPVFAADGVEGVTPGNDAATATATINAIVGGEGEGESEGEEGDELDIGLDEPNDSAEEFEDLDHDGLKLKVPKGRAKDVEESLLRYADYTKKTQEVAEIRKAVEAKEKAFAERTEHDNAIGEGKVHLKMMDNDLNKEYTFFQSPEYRKLQEDDFVAAQARFNRFQVNRDARNQLANALGVLEHERNSKLALAADAEKQETSKRREQLPREIAKLVPGWNADMAGKVKEFGVSLGYAPEALDSSTDPLHFQTLHFARIGKMYLDAKARKGQGAVTLKTTQPTKTVGQRGGAVPTGPSDKMSTEQWMEAERKRVAAQSAKRKAR